MAEIFATGAFSRRYSAASTSEQLRTIEARATLVTNADEFDTSAVHDALYRSTRRPMAEAMRTAWRALRRAAQPARGWSAAARGESSG
jgi:hypothetical protein